MINNLVAWAFTTGDVLIKSDGSPWRPFVHVEDICRAFLAVLQSPGVNIHNQIFNIGSTSENYQVFEIAEMVQSSVPGCKIVYEEGGGP